MRIAFMGTPDFAARLLSDLAAWATAQGHEIVAVYSQPPREAGRGKKPQPSPVHGLADSLGIPVFTPIRLRDTTDQAAFAALDLDLAVVAAYGLILPKAILDAARLGCLNVHASLLPRWRGAAPIHRAIMAGDEMTGVCIMRMEEGLDTGPVYRRREIPIGPETTTGELHDALAALGSAPLFEAIGDVQAGAVPVPQPDEGVTYARKIDKAEARIDWSRPAAEVDRVIRGLSPFPGAWFEARGERIKVLRSRLVEGGGAAGAVLDDCLTIACGTGAVQLTELQRAGKGAMDAATLLRGFPLGTGEILG
ncbi:methionyl-tRNA formyltransferase [Iodidimonas sp. SYSU 1G8]|uniref:methionyl-tRNA formyltransferase n=1 Tax=Iodidimonas sp. SYSU 1G8 TaxID=3133967 RepID=UPI0031FE9E5F